MTKITLDSAACQKLGNIDGSAEICDDTGHVVGYFVSGESKPGQPPSDLRIPLSIAETEDRRKVRTGRTLSEILSGLNRQ